MTTPITIANVSKHYGGTAAVNQVSLRIEAGEMFFLLGPSGCGKTTLLRILAGFVQPDAGEIHFGTQRITHLPPRLRDAGMVFQTYALWPHMTVAKNVAYGLQVRGLAKKEIAQRVTDALKLVRLDGWSNSRPTQLSGGQQQRVALARALVVKPRVLLLDEPLSNLDARLRDEMREEIRRLHQETGLTMIYVTHDQKEALSLADRLAVMEYGKLVQVGAPREVYDRPATAFIARFLGDSNFCPAEVVSCDNGAVIVETELGRLHGMMAHGQPAPAMKLSCSIRPQALALAPPAVTGPNLISGEVRDVAFLGDWIQLRVLVNGQNILNVASPPHVAGRLKPGDAVTLKVDPEQVVLIPD